jgi:GNAT superfamily N-acetyltransferase
MTGADMKIRRMTRDELDTLIYWAAHEGWNPGLDDAEAFWAANPDGFVVAEIDGELVGGGAIIAYEKRYGFMGLFLVRPDHRGHGLGNRLWHERDISGRHAPAFFEHGSIGQEAIPLPWWKLKKYAVMP